MSSLNWDQISTQDETTLLDALFASGIFKSKGEARRLIEQGAVRIDKEQNSDPFFNIKRPNLPIVIQAGKRNFFKIVDGDGTS